MLSLRFRLAPHLFPSPARATVLHAASPRPLHSPKSVSSLDPVKGPWRLHRGKAKFAQV